MKKLASRLVARLTLLALGATALFSTGCATPAYSGTERGQMIVRNWDMQLKMMSDDIDYMAGLRPVSQLSEWNVR